MHKGGWATLPKSKVKSFLHHKWFIAILILSVLIRQIWLLSLIERDEGGIALVALQWIKGFPPYIYSINNAGPLTYLIYAFPTYVFGPDMIPVRIINNLLFFLSVVAFYLVIAQQFDKKVATFSSFFYGVFMSAPIYEGQLALSSSLSASFVVFSIYFCSKYLENSSKKALFIASFFFGCASLIKFHNALGIFLLLLAVILKNKSKEFDLKRTMNDFMAAIIGFSILSIIFLSYFWNLDAIDNILDILIGRTLFGHLGAPGVPFGITFNVVVQALPLWIFNIFGIVISLTHRTRFEVFSIWWLILAITLAAFPPHFGHRYIYLLAPASVFAGMSAATTFKGFRFKVSKWLRLDRESFTSLFLFILLTLSFLPAISFQAEQYPQYHIFSQSLNFTWRYDDPDSYETQIKLAEFLRRNTSKDGEILVHGSTATIYYLAGKLPPSMYVWTLGDIPEYEYNRLLENVSKLEFEYIIFFDSDLASLERRSWDPIVEQTLGRYFFIDQFGNGLIFGKYDSFKNFVN